MNIVPKVDLNVITRDPGAAYHYALAAGVRFPEGESAIATDAFFAFYYAKFIIKGRFLEGEPAIRKHLSYTTYYATEVIKGRWPEAEYDIVNSDSEWKSAYLRVFTINELVEYFKINSDELLMLKLKYNDAELRDYLIINYVLTTKS